MPIISDEELNASGRMDDNKKITRAYGIRSLGAKDKNPSSEKERETVLVQKNCFFDSQRKIQEKDFALFEWKEVCCQFNKENFNKLGSELILLAWGEYFAESFNEQIRSSGVKNIPMLRWNTKDIFIGKLVDEVKDTTDSSQSSSPVEPSI
ncbi:hypothetical protein BU17DRAFT_71272 [Hysterangium stoloniferum]|nr:hypothetical protein BU17DRAFT_71272 [Hysterangium stoloniferum]